MILRVEGGLHNHWASFGLTATKGSPLALNARVRLTAGDLVQLDEIRSGGSYISQNDLRLHFGLGSHDRMDKVEVFWPSGEKEVQTNLPADRYYTLREAQGVV